MLVQWYMWAVDPLPKYSDVHFSEKRFWWKEKWKVGEKCEMCWKVRKSSITTQKRAVWDIVLKLLSRASQRCPRKWKIMENFFILFSFLWKTHFFKVEKTNKQFQQFRWLVSHESGQTNPGILKPDWFTFIINKGDLLKTWIMLFYLSTPHSQVKQTS